ncbi:MAG: hemerythrin domain-containing protein [Bacteroidota bacterium]|nr:hemerythrin domain-containing protein [Bacteroidota bacterium]MDP4230731.1 hemerythrin domain-containing protein [Bacteroidota bacterium]MDP4236286.1 hemerythrin domain-containing protein [Bacteroidota bacterium]
MPRHSTLVPLSHDHHEALLIALRLKKGGPASANDRLWPADLHAQIHSLQLFGERELLPHFKLEEDKLFPVASKLIELQEVIYILKGQHARLRQLLAGISVSKEEDTLNELLREFGTLLESHVRLEERELFPKLEIAEAEGKITLPVLK